jgi:hypothetical protein
MEPKDRGIGSGSGTTRAFYVEIMTTYGQPQQHPWGFIVDSTWRRVPLRIVKCDRADHKDLRSGNIGDIPVRNFNSNLDDLGLSDFGAAYSAACQVQQCGEHGGICFKLRLVEVEVEWSFKTKIKGHTDEFSLFDLGRSLRAKPIEGPESK